MTRPRVHVIVLNYNGWHNTIECLESVFRSDYPDFRVLVVDNGSTDGSSERIREWADGRMAAPSPPIALAHLSVPPVQKPIPHMECTRRELEVQGGLDWSRTSLCLVHAGANLGFSGGNNIALRYILAHEPRSLSLLLNNDTVIAPTAISAMVRSATDGSGELRAVGATILQYHAPERIETLGGNTLTAWHGCTTMIGWNASRAATRPRVDLSYISGCCLMVSHATLSRVGILDERFFIYNEDADWGVRARTAGVRLEYSQAAEVWHKGSATMVARTPFHDYHNTKSVLHFARKHRPRTFPVALVYLTARFMLAKFARGEWSRLAAVRSAFRDFFAERRLFAAGQAQ